MPVVGEYKQGERGREAPKSLLGEKMIEASANIALRITFVCVSVLRDERDELRVDPLEGARLLLL